MTLQEIVRLILRRWWLVLIVPALTLALLVARARTQDYQSTFNAIVLLPGDTEIPGNSERPELMVMDDAPAFVESGAFAGAVAADLSSKGVDVSIEEAQAALSADRYSRVLTVRAASDDASKTKAMADAAAALLPDQINRYLVADQTEPATVQVIDPPGAASRSRPHQVFQIVVLTGVALAAGVALSLLAHAWAEQIPLFYGARSKQQP